MSSIGGRLLCARCSRPKLHEVHQPSVGTCEFLKPVVQKRAPQMARGKSRGGPANRFNALPMPERFWSKVNSSGGPRSCWEWMGGGRPYGRFEIEHSARLAHRVAYELTNGPIPRGLAVCHRCDNPPCVNPDHLFIGTLAENNADMYTKGRGRYPVRFGSAISTSKLTDEQVLDIRRQALEGTTQREIGERFGVSKQAIGYIVRRQTWGHI